MAIFTVTNGGDSGIGSLRQAVIDSNSTLGSNIINFDPSVSLIVLTSSTLNVTNSVTVNGHGSGLLEVRRDILSPLFNIWEFTGLITFNLYGMTISNGVQNSIAGGGGISSYSAVATIFNADDIFVKNCSSTLGSGGGIRIDGGSRITTLTNIRVEECSQDVGVAYGIYFTVNSGGSGGTISITDSIITNNDNTDPDNGNGGAIYITGNFSSATLDNIEIYNNLAKAGNDINITNVPGSVSLDRISIHDNNYTGSTGTAITFTNVPSFTVRRASIYSNPNEIGINIGSNCVGSLSDSTFSDLGSTGILNLGAVTEIVNCTISGNTANNVIAAGIFINLSSSNVTILDTTIANNISTGGGTGGILRSLGTVSVGNTIIAENSGVNPDVSGSFVTLGNNLIGNSLGSTSFINGINGDQVGNILSPINPLLAPLANNGGFTQTMALIPGSPAIDAGNIAINPVGNLYDQRGFPYSRISGSSIDIGAYETQNIVCYSGNSIVNIKNILDNKIYDLQVKYVKASDHLVYDTENKIYIPIIYNLQAGTTSKFKLIKKNLFDINIPFSDLHITPGHMILYNGNLVKARDIPGVEDIELDMQIVYSICTNKSRPIMINGISVMTWGREKWLKYAAENHITWINN